MIEVGFNEYHWNKWITKLNKKTYKKTFSTAVVDFARVDEVFYLLFIGYLVSLTICVGEVVVRKAIKRESLISVVEFSYQRQ